MEAPEAKDYLIETFNPDSLDEILNRWGAALVGGGTPGGYVRKDGYYVMRVFGDIGFIRFAFENQGYGKIIEELPELV